MHELPLTAKELGLMTGRPVPPDKRVTHANQLVAPYNRWSFQNELKLNRTTDVWKGPGSPSDLSAAYGDLGSVTYRNRAGERFTFEDMVEMSHTDAIVVLQGGKVVYERYLNGMEPTSLHAWASASKSVVGLLVAHFAAEGLIDLEQKVDRYLPALGGSGFADATVRQVLDMTTAVGFPDEDPDPISESQAYAVCMGWRHPGGPEEEVESIYEFLARMKPTGTHGEKFTYQTPNTDVLAWLLAERTGRSLSELTSAVLWSRIGPERDAFWIVNPEGVETAGSGFVSTVRDMARLGRWILGQPAVLADMGRGGDKEAFARGPAASPLNQGQSYRSQWWVSHDTAGSFQALGYGGQHLYLAPQADLVVAKMSSFPTPTPAGNEFYAAMGAFPALVRFLGSAEG